MQYGTGLRRTGWTMAALLLPACSDPLGREQDVDYVRTPAGYPVRWEEEGSLGSGYFTLEVAFRWYEEAVERACDHLARYGTSREQTREVARSTLTWLIDNYRRDGWTGINNMRDPGDGGWIKVCLYRAGHVEADGQRPTEVNGWPVPPWTHFTGPDTGRLYYGYVDEAAGLFPALGHEIGHSLFGPDFEHTYFPSQANGRSIAGPRWTRTAQGCTPEN